MFSIFRSRFGIPGAISVIALVFAMLGGAYAASGPGGGGATASAKGKPGSRGPRGKAGPVGPAGLAGPQGPAGAVGSKGDTGPMGPTGPTGPTGISGFTKTLPSGETEQGAWGTIKPDAGISIVSISFPIPLADELNEAEVHVVTAEEVEKNEVEANHPECAVAGVEGSPANPLAQPGNLCVFNAPSLAGGKAALIRKATSFAAVGAATSGALLFIGGAEGEIINGTFAVTAPLP